MIIPFFLALTAQTVPLGTNINGLSDYDPTQLFCDAFKTARTPFGSAAAPFDGKATPGPDGWPVGDWGAVIFTGITGTEGVYQLSFSGKASVSAPGSNATISNVVYDDVKNTSSASVTVGKDSQLFLSFKGVAKNVSVLRDGCSTLYNPKALENLKFYKAIRLMDFLHTNDNPITTWATRKLPYEPTQTGARGGAIEYGIDLCNALHADCWLNIPAMADDDYITQMAKLVKSRLDPALRVYTEYSNEVWNSIFSQTSWNYEQAKKDVAAGQTDLSLEGTDSNTFYWGRRRVAKRAARIGVLFKNELGSDRVRPILATQFGDVSVARAQLGYLYKYLSPINTSIYGLAVAPYFATQADDQAGATLQNVIDGINNSVTSNVARFEAKTWDGKTYSATSPDTATLAKFYGIKHLAYEGGQHLLGTTAAAQALDLQVQSTNEMGLAYEKYLKGWFSQGGGLFMHFVAISSWSKNGYWGLQNDPKVSTPKFEAAKRVALVSGPIDTPIDPKDAVIADLKSQVAHLQSIVDSDGAALATCDKDLDTANNALIAALSDRDALSAVREKVRADVK